MRIQPYSVSIAVILLSASLTAVAQEPEIVNARLDQASAAKGLAAAIAEATRQDAGPAWMAYALPAIADGKSHNRWDSCSADLEEGSKQARGSGPLHQLEDRSILIFLRTRQQQIEKVRMFEGDCRVDADGMTVHWLTGVNPADSVALLRPLVERDSGGDERHSRGAALAAIASTEDPSADGAMQQFTRPPSPEALRKDAVFWLGAARGVKGHEMLQGIVKTDPSDDVRDKAIFALSVSPVPQAIDTLIDVARHDPTPHLRAQALFWLGQKAGVRAAGAISNAAEDDPDTDVKKKAVFALSQLPPDQGVPLLIQVAQSNRNPEVRKQAFFWLGQSKDPRALDFIARVLMN